MMGQMLLSMKGGVVAGPRTDMFLIRANGTHGSTAFVDEAGNTVTTHGAAHISNAQTLLANECWASGAGGRIEVAGIDVIGTQDFILEFWIRPTSLPVGYSGAYHVPFFRGGGVAGSMLILSDYSFPNILVLYFYDASGTPWQVGVLPSLTANVTTALAIQRKLGELRFYTGGTHVSTVAADAYTSMNLSASGNIGLGGYAGGLYPLLGYMDEMRLRIGVAPLTGSYTVTTTEFPYP